MLAGYLGAFITTFLAQDLSWWAALACAPLGGSLAVLFVAVWAYVMFQEEEGDAAQG